jgi:hypothetical protein
MAVKTFTSGAVLTASDTNNFLTNAGLVYITSVTVGTAVASVTVSSAFGSYDDVKILYDAGLTSASAPEIKLTIGSVASGYYASGTYQLATSATNNTDNLGPGAHWRVGYGGNQRMRVEVDLLGANNTYGKCGNYRFSSYDNTASYGGHGSLWSTITTASTSLTFAPASGTLTGGTITVYGYRKA